MDKSIAAGWHCVKGWIWWDFHGRTDDKLLLTHINDDKYNDDNVHFVIWNRRDIVNNILYDWIIQCHFCCFTNISDSALFAVCEDNL